MSTRILSLNIALKQKCNDKLREVNLRLADFHCCFLSKCKIENKNNENRKVIETNKKEVNEKQSEVLELNEEVNEVS